NFKKMTQIIPALITSDEDSTNDFKELKLKFEKLQPFLADFDNWVQIDITDGKFVPTETVINLEDLKYFTEKADVEFHLMINRPEKVIGEWARIGPKRIIVHIEAVEDMDELLNVCREKDIELGLALNPETPNMMIEPWINAVDLILFLGVHPGQGGQKFIPEVLEKIKSLRRNFPNVKIEVDGGVRTANIEELKKAGADIFVIGSGILKSPNIGTVIGELKLKLCPNISTMKK
ncbi:MAG: ribulose-phosphate 3-epimerase, partial [Candidatus Azambacteria bacterium]|nr:ribulose-phosphate 3-epimerase [Candidatus Azambacteria bacterium]